ncbi:hypothetical protein K438DRAFT_2023671 [Mycena galopus ATCC 62051]|nr:hypothetical protein K438DRAFT_2023671 [Mycena galopus ATCC 62051]
MINMTRPSSSGLWRKSGLGRHVSGFGLGGNQKLGTLSSRLSVIRIRLFSRRSTSHYSGVANYADMRKFQQLMLDDPVNGAAQIQKLIWTDMLGGDRFPPDPDHTRECLCYRVRLAICDTSTLACSALVADVTSATSAILVLVTTLLEVSHLRFLLTHTGSGRIALGDSALRPAHHGPGLNPGYITSSIPMGMARAR